MYTETLGRWGTIDLFVGLAYLSNKETSAWPATDIARKGRQVNLACSKVKNLQLQVSALSNQHTVPPARRTVSDQYSRRSGLEGQARPQRARQGSQKSRVKATVRDHAFVWWICAGLHMQDELMEIRRYMLYCRGLKFKTAQQQARFWIEHTGIGTSPLWIGLDAHLAAAPVNHSRHVDSQERSSALSTQAGAALAVTWL